ncbi:MAG: asparagine synthase (glutamine-hydrolyzing) [Candidatus Yanofskybacteria bacterium]|nr:asparagine synthase (glutamine-hydrolyzing) [Candidatus Yanofskybacteria bacterium]
MCGIAGFVGKGTAEDIERMTATLLHRGPDAQGSLLKGNVALGSTRLAIIDVRPEGNQPMVAAGISLVFNGEIYNFQEVRKELEQAGHQFKTRTDTEVILTGYRAYGEKIFEKLNGMFALAIYDEPNQKLILARDRMGKKPLYWSYQNSTLVFGSELKALMSHPHFEKKINATGLRKYLFYEYIPSPETIFEHTHKLEPASYLTFQNGKIQKQAYWQPNFSQNTISFPEAKAELDQLLVESTKKRLVADVPLGIFLSGGIDSSTIAYYAQQASTEKIKTFSIGFEEKSFDESEYALRVARHLDTDHNHEILGAKNSLDLIPALGDMLDEPLADASILPTYLLSHSAKKHVTVALSGDGGDELLAGYGTFVADRFLPWYEKIPSGIRKTFESLIARIPASESNFSREYQFKKFIQGAGVPEQYRHHYWLASFLPHEQEGLLTSPADINVLNDLDRYWQESSSASDARNKILYLYQRTYMMDGVLAKVDRASMRASLEVRSPFLDYRVVSFLNQLPYKFKYPHSGKYILKELMKDKLPIEIINRNKKGFGIPLARWLKYELRPLVEELLDPTLITSQGIFNSEYIEQLKRDHFSGVRDNRKELWTLLVFQLWHRRWM